MFSYLVRRLLIMIPMMLAATFLMFMVVSLSGDPLGEVRMQQPPPPPEVLEQMAKTLRLDQPILTRYWLWLTGMLTGDFGPSLRGMDIGAELVARMGVSLRLLVLGLVIALVMAIVATIIGAVFQFSIADHIISVIAVITISMPVFWLAILLKRGAIEVNRTVGFRMFYTVGDGSGIATETNWQKVMILVGVLSLPTIALALQSFGAWSRYGRVALIEALTSEYVKLARAKGLSERRVILAHGLRTAFAPMLTVFSASAAVVLGESVVTEHVFQWRGMGDLLVTGIQNNDVYVVLAWLLAAGLLIMVFNLVADVLYALLDPESDMTSADPAMAEIVPAQAVYRPWRTIMLKFLSYKVSAASLLVLLLIVVFAFGGEYFWRYSFAVPTSNLSARPSWAHPFGTDNLGYDVMAAVMRGAKRSLSIAGVVAVLSTVVGAIWGAAAAYVGGWVDNLMMRIVDLLMIFPVLAIAAFLNRQIQGGASGWLLVALVLSGLSWPIIARVVRSVVLSLRTRDFVTAARIAGAGPIRIIFRHLLPNAAGPIIVAATVLSATAVLSETALSYLGFGVQPPDTSLGLLINSAQGAVSTRPWIFYFPGFFMIMIALCMSFIGDGLRAAIDPRQQRK